MMAAFVFAYSFAQDNIALKESQLMYIDHVYRNDSISHTAWKPILLTDSIVQPSQHSWLRRKFFEEHLLSVQQPGFNLYGDIIVDEHIGYDTRFVTPPNPSPQVYHVPE